MTPATHQDPHLDGGTSPPTGHRALPTPGTTPRARLGRLALVLTLAAMLALLVWSATHTDLPQFRGKAMTGRLLCFPLAAAIVPVGWWLARRRSSRPVPFPYAAAVLVALPFVVDLAGNATRLYVEVEDFDDAVHAVNPVLFVAALALLLDRTQVPRWATWTMAFGLGCAGHIAWEIIEYLLLEGVGAVELDLSLRDTLTDQAWGLLGAAVGATLPLLPRSRAGLDRAPEGGRGRTGAVASGRAGAGSLAGARPWHSPSDVATGHRCSSCLQARPPTTQEV